MSTIRLINPVLFTFFSKLDYRVNEIRIIHTYADYGNQTRLPVITRVNLLATCYSVPSKVSKWNDVNTATEP